MAATENNIDEQLNTNNKVEPEIIIPVEEEVDNKIDEQLNNNDKVEPEVVIPVVEEIEYDICMICGADVKIPMGKRNICITCYPNLKVRCKTCKEIKTIIQFTFGRTSCRKCFTASSNNKNKKKTQ